MSKITVNFKNLCALFTKKLDDELMVGLLDLTDFHGVPAEDIHYPKITIETEKKVVNPNGEIVVIPQVWKYEGFKRCCSPEGGEHAMHQSSESNGSLLGDIQLEVFGLAPGLNRNLTPTKIAELKERENKRRPEDKPIKVDNFDKSLDIEKELYSGKPLTVLPGLCKARFHFRHGTLYSIFPVPPIPTVFQPPGSGAPDGNYPVETGLEIEAPENGYAVLRFLNADTPDFVFQGGADQSYHVTIENSPPKHENHDAAASDPNHFRFYYKLVKADPPLDPMYLPTTASSPNADPFCMNGGFGGGSGGGG